MIVDAQVHLWLAETPDRPWPPDGAERAHLATPFTYLEMLELMDANEIDRAIIVPPSFEGDRNDYALEAAANYPDRFAVMGRITLNEPQAQAAISEWLKIPGMLGIRANFSREQAKWLDDGMASWFWAAAENAGIPVMVHGPSLASKFGRIAQDHPHLHLIIDHMNLSDQIKRDRTVPAAIAATAALASYSNISVKVSSIPVYSSERYPFRDMDVHLRTIINAFGVTRCFWGSDVSHSHGLIPYKEFVTHFTEHLDFLSSEDKKLIMGDNILNLLQWKNKSGNTDCR